MYIRLKLLILIILLSCECPPELDTGKEIIPSEYSNVCFLNVSENYATFDVYYRKMLVAQDIVNTTSGSFDYIKFPTGNANINYKTNEEIIFNSIFYNTKDEYHTIIFYEKDNSANILLLKEEFKSLQENGKIRIIHLANYPKIIAKVISSLPQPVEIKLNTGETTNLLEFASGQIKLQIFNYEDNTLIQEIENTEIKLNQIINIIITGDTLSLDFSVLRSTRNK
jgi:hypothetical protein